MKKYDIRNPATGGKLLSSVAFNLMFQTSIGPSSNNPAYLTDETAQGQFSNFQKLFNFINEVMPPPQFASTSIGKSFRNEIAPKSGLLRVREFLMAEIEHFVDPEGGKKHHSFAEVKHIKLDLLNRDVQFAGKSQVQSTPMGGPLRLGLLTTRRSATFLHECNPSLRRLA